MSHFKTIVLSFSLCLTLLPLSPTADAASCSTCPIKIVDDCIKTMAIMGQRNLDGRFGGGIKVDLTFIRERCLGLFKRGELKKGIPPLIQKAGTEDGSYVETFSHEDLPAQM